MSTENSFSKFRWIENIHILLWLIKDTCWSLEFKLGGMLMILPTVSVAFFLLIKNRKNRSELFHNIAVCCWILANSTWMTGEFYKLELRPIAAGTFILGAGILIFYYIFLFKKDTITAEEHGI